MSNPEPTSPASSTMKPAVPPPNTGGPDVGTNDTPMPTVKPTITPGPATNSGGGGGGAGLPDMTAGGGGGGPAAMPSSNGSGGTPSTPAASGPTGTTAVGGSDSGSVGGADGTTGGAGEMPATGEFKLTAPDWHAGEDCNKDAKDTCDNIPVENRATMIGGMNIMPTISWTAGPEGTKSYAVVYQDETNGLAHYALWNIPPDVTSVGPDSIPTGASQAALAGMTWFGSGACENVYQLGVYALSVDSLNPMGTKQTAVRDQLDMDDGTIVLAKDFGRVTPKAPCGN